MNVGTQVSGIVQTLSADFNDIVRKGQMLARLDPSLFQTQVEQAEANLVRAEAEVEQLKVARDAAKLALDRTAKLAEKRLVSDADLEAAQVAVASADAQVRSAAGVGGAGEGEPQPGQGEPRAHHHHVAD